MAEKQKRYVSKGDGKENSDTARFVAEPVPSTVAAYARNRMHVILDGQLPQVILTTRSGQECKGAVDAAAELHRLATIVCGSAPEIVSISNVIRMLLRQILNALLTGEHRVIDPGSLSAEPDVPTALTDDDLALLELIDKATLYAVAKRLAEALSTESTLQILHTWEELYVASEVDQSPKLAKVQLEELLIRRAEDRLRRKQSAAEIEALHEEGET